MRLLWGSGGGGGVFLPVRGAQALKVRVLSSRATSRRPDTALIICSSARKFKFEKVPPTPLPPPPFPRPPTCTQSSMLPHTARALSPHMHHRIHPSSKIEETIKQHHQGRVVRVSYLCPSKKTVNPAVTSPDRLVTVRNPSVPMKHACK